MQAAGLRRGKISHKPEGAAAQIVSGERGHQEHNDRLKERSGDDAAEEQRSAVNLTIAPPEDVDDGDGDGGAEECANGSNEPGHFGGKIKPPFHDESDDRAKSGTGRNTEHVRIG